VHDQDEALAFYTEKLGMELREDVSVPELGNFRYGIDAGFRDPSGNHMRLVQ
jgi:catechol 2,3-dioxygenase-like lactoylglutathione lyase family enzyme